MQSPSDTPATGWPGGASACSKVTVVPSSSAKRPAQATGSSTSAPTKACWVAGARTVGGGGRAARRRSGDRPPARRCSTGRRRRRIAGVGEAHLRAGPGGDVHLLLLQVRHGRLEVLDLEGDGVQAAPEARDELRRARPRRWAGRSRSRCRRPRPSRPGARYPALRLAVLQHRRPTSTPRFLTARS